MRVKAVLMDSAKMRRTVIQLAHVMFADNASAERIVLVGLGKRGFSLAREMSGVMSAESGRRIPAARLDVGDGEETEKAARELGFSASGNTVIIVNDILRTGKSVLAANEALFKVGMPSGVRVAVLVDCSDGSEVMRANYIGLKTKVAPSDIVSVSVNDVDGVCGVDVFAVDN